MVYRGTSTRSRVFDPVCKLRPYFFTRLAPERTINYGKGQLIFTGTARYVGTKKQKHKINFVIKRANTN